MRRPSLRFGPANNGWLPLCWRRAECIARSRANRDVYSPRKFLEGAPWQGYRLRMAATVGHNVHWQHMARGRVRASHVWTVLRWAPACLVLLALAWSPTAPDRSDRILQITAPSQFRLLDWETTNVSRQLDRIWWGLISPASVQPPDGGLVQVYFDTPQEERAPLRLAAEGAMERAIATTYQTDGATRPTLFGQRVFPPFVFSFSAPPNVLIVSPRTALQVDQSVLLKSDLDVPTQEAIEKSTGSLDVSGLVTSIGGIGAAYPSMVLDSGDPRDVLRRAAHEWVHQYLFFSPLGADYWSSQEAREINETAADIVSVEVGDQAFGMLGLNDSPSPPAGPPGSDAAFSFTRFMRATRLQTEQLLADGRIDDAEAYMDQRRDQLQNHGYYFRKINQAFFAFYGSFGGGFGASPGDPTADLLQKLRAQSPTVGAFMETLGQVTSLDQLQRAVADS